MNTSLEVPQWCRIVNLLNANSRWKLSSINGLFIDNDRDYGFFLLFPYKTIIDRRFVVWCVIKIQIYNNTLRPTQQCIYLCKTATKHSTTGIIKYIVQVHV